MSLAGLVIGGLVLALFDLAMALIGMGSYGRANGWLAAILPIWLFIEEFRTSPAGPARTVAALVATVVSVVGGLLVAGLASGLPPLASGVLATIAFTVLYALIWFHGVRWLITRGY